MSSRAAGGRICYLAVLTPRPREGFCLGALSYVSLGQRLLACYQRRLAILHTILYTAHHTAHLLTSSTMTSQVHSPLASTFPLSFAGASPADEVLALSVGEFWC